MQTAETQVAPVPQAAVATPSATLQYEAAKGMRQELRGQLDALVKERHGYLRELEDHDVPGQATAGMQQRIAQLDARIADTDKLIATADARVAQAAALPGAVVVQSRVERFGPPRAMFVIGPLFLLSLFIPISIAITRRLWRRGTSAVAEFPREVMDRLSRLEAMGEATSLEVERIGEGQRFVTRILTESQRDRIGVPGSSEPR